MNVLWLASWFPGRTHATNGDFVERQALALGKIANLTVLVVTKDETMQPGTHSIEAGQYGGITVYRAYYGRSRWGKWAEAFFSFRAYQRLQVACYQRIVTERGKPDVVHVHVAMKAGLLALWLKKRHRLPYWVTEHWTGYYPQSRPSFYEQHLMFRLLTKRILQHAVALLPVSADLGKTINERVARVPFTVVPNVVDTTLFYYRQQPFTVFRFIHPSYLNHQKNPEGILAAAGILAARGYRFELLFAGGENERLAAKAKTIDAPGVQIRFLQAVPYGRVAQLMQDAQALLLFSRFENLPCVVLEALCCGLPVISTAVGGIGEVITRANGLLVENEQVTQLADAMEQMINNYSAYNRAAIALDAAARFACPVVAQQISDCYTAFRPSS